MTISVWRYSHLALAVSSFLFIALASLSGIILAFEPVSHQMSAYRVSDFDKVTIAQSVTGLKRSYPGITDITVDANGFVTAKGTDKAGKKLFACVDPRNGRLLGAPYRQSDFFQWVTAFHRSLFLHKTGRFFVGLVSFLLLLIAVSGTVLVIQRQRGIRRFFGSIAKENFAQYGHVVLGRLSLIPIIIIALTGTYLSLSRFNFFPDQKIRHQVDIDHMKTDLQVKIADFPVFKHTLLSDVRTIQFPFSEFPEDYFTVKLKDREIVVNQFTGDVLSDVSYNRTSVWLNWSLNLHTGRTNIVWALVLAVACANILFFIWSGFVITLKRRAGRVKNKFGAGDSHIIILVGSENGTTFTYAGAVYNQLIQQGKKVFVTELNNYQVFPAAGHLIVMAATYGLGDAPTNAQKFVDLIKQYPQTNRIKYSVVGFGSHAYPDFCKFAFEVNNALVESDWATSIVDVHTVNDKSPSDFALWMEAWSQQSGMQLTVPAEPSGPTADLSEIVVLSNTRAANVSGTFLLRLAFSERQQVTSGDLLAIYPANDHRERLYSIGKIGNELQLSVRLHEGGLGSAFLHNLKPGETFKAKVSGNPHFHFPKQAKSVIMIANGTGIAPFLGMIDQNERQVPVSLYCGFREAASYSPYRDFLEQQKQTGKLLQIKPAFSREGEQQYVTGLITADASDIIKTLQQGGYIMLCGSLAMQKDVFTLLDEICSQAGHRLSDYQSHGQILSDCY